MHVLYMITLTFVLIDITTVNYSLKLVHPKSILQLSQVLQSFSEKTGLIIWLEESVSLGKGPPPLKNNITHDSRLLFYDLTLFFSQADFIK